MSNVRIPSTGQAGATAPAEAAPLVRSPRFRIGDTNSHAIASRITAIFKRTEGDRP